MRISSGIAADANVTDRTARDLGFVRDFFYRELGSSRLFIAGSTVSQGVGNYSHIQIMNPAASGVTLVIVSLIVSLGTAEVFLINAYNTALATLERTGANLDSGAAAAKGTCRSEGNVAQLGTILGMHQVLASSPLEIFPRVGHQLGAGEGLVVLPNATNIRITATAIWEEF